MQYLVDSNKCAVELAWWNEGTRNEKEVLMRETADQQLTRGILENGTLINPFAICLLNVLLPIFLSLCHLKIPLRRIFAVTNKSMCAGLVLLILGTSNLTIVAAEPNADTENAGDKERVENVDYEELAGIFKKYNGKHNYTADQVKALRRASLSESKITDNDFKKLSGLKDIILWNLGRCHNLTRESLPVLKSLTGARAIDLADTKKLFNDYDEIVDTFKDYKNLEFLSVHLVDKEPTEKYKEFLKERPQLTALVGVYSQKQGGYRLMHKEALHSLLDKWVEEGVITQEELKTSFK